MTVQAPIACIVGPTAAGKSAIAVAAIEACGSRAGVISCDAYAVYRGMPILTAAPDSTHDLPHRLVGIIGADETYDAARFFTDCDYEIDALRDDGRDPWIVGGTALYLRCWLKGLGTGVPRHEVYRKELRTLADLRGPGALHEKLEALDPTRAAALHPNDLRRVVRALEIIAATGRPASEQRLEWQAEDRVEASIVGIRRTREDLHRRVAQRTAEMFDAGVVEEVRLLRASPMSPEAKQTLGFTEVCAVLDGTMSEAEAKAIISQKSLRFARKQMTFFRSFADVRWVNVAAKCDVGDAAARVVEALSTGPSSGN